MTTDTAILGANEEFVGDEEFEEYTDEYGVVKKRSLGRRILDRLTGKTRRHRHEHKHI